MDSKIQPYSLYQTFNCNLPKVDLSIDQKHPYPNTQTLYRRSSKNSVYSFNYRTCPYIWRKSG